MTYRAKQGTQHIQTVTQTPFYYDSGHSLWLSPVPQIPGTSQGTEGGIRLAELPLRLSLLPCAAQKKPTEMGESEAQGQRAAEAALRAVRERNRAGCGQIILSHFHFPLVFPDISKQFPLFSPQSFPHPGPRRRSFRVSSEITSPWPPE